MKRTPMKQGGQLQRSAFKRRAPTTTTGILSVQAHQRTAPAKKAAMKTKQRPVTAEEKTLWSRLAALGCIACMKDGNFNPHVSIHHVDGRTKPGCHQLVLPLCAGHHQDGTGEDKTMLAVHPWKARFERRYGSQAELMAACRELLSTTKSEAATGFQPDAASVK
jgi:hypothetical protein